MDSGKIIQQQIQHQPAQMQAIDLLNLDTQQGSSDAVVIEYPIPASGSWLDTVQEVWAREVARDEGWTMEPRITNSGMWIWVPNDKASMPRQGWKLHVSAGLPFAAEVLHKAMAVLLSANANFKVAATLQML